MKFLIIGDIVGKSGLNKLQEKYKSLIEKHKIDFSIINGENASHGKGLRLKEYEIISSLGVDAITMGNHIYYRKEMATEYSKLPNLLIPANVTNLVGNGSIVVEKNNIKVGIINLLGKVGLTEITQENVECPFKVAKEQVDKLKKLGCKYIFVDFHAEATAEKIALGYYLEEDVTCVYGTHTHVQTADEKILKTGMAYITDIGMTGPNESVIGLVKEIALKRFSTGEFVKYSCSENESTLNGIIVETDDNTNKCISIQRISES